MKGCTFRRGTARRSRRCCASIFPVSKSGLMAADVNGRSHDGSDLDLVLRGPKLAEIDASRLADFIGSAARLYDPFPGDRSARLGATAEKLSSPDSSATACRVGGERPEWEAAEWRETIYGRFASDFVEDCLVNLCNQINGVQTGPFGSQLHKKDPGYPFNRTHPGRQFSRGGSLEGDPGSAGARAPGAAWATPPGAAWWR